MAASNQFSGFHFAALFFLLLSIGLGVSTYMFQREYSTALEQKQKFEGDYNTANTALKKSLDDVEALKGVLGHRQPTVSDTANPANPNTVVGGLTADLKAQGGQLAQPTVKDTLARLRTELDAVILDRDSIKANLAKEHTDLLALQGQYQERTDKHSAAKTAAEGDLQKQIAKTDEMVRERDNQINRLRETLNQLQDENAQIRDASEKQVKAKQDEINNLVLRLNRLSEELDEARRVSFEVPDGEIRKVDSTTRKVYVNLGEADYLRLRTTFSVYAHDNYGVARGPEDIKGKIEVSKIIGPHLAEARILEEDLYRPIAPKDMIYTPLWSPGRPEEFAFVGTIDLDDDGKSDFDTLKYALDAAGAKIVSYVDDNGERHGGPISEQTKLLVVGTIPEADSIAPQDQPKYDKLTEHLKDMRKEAREQGVRRMPLSEFIAYMGFKPKQRLFVPGEKRPFNLKAGAASASTDEPLGSREADGQTSSAYGPKRKSVPKTSLGTTSKLFRSGSGE